MQKTRLSNPFGYIDYSYRKPDLDYPNGLLVFMGSYVEKKYRGQGKFKDLVKTLFSLFPNGTEVHLGISNPIIVNMFTKNGFRQVGFIEYWGSTTNTIKLKGKIGNFLI